ncbi:MAG: TonB-dependent receptor plug domain-containing protein [Marinicellaceae bacterium]
MRLIGFCLLFACLTVSAESQILSQSMHDWINYFKKNNIQIIYSSDFLKKADLNKTLDAHNSLTSFNQALKSLSLTLIEIDELTYVINPTKQIKSPITGLIIKLKDTNNRPIKSFTINGIETKNGIIVFDNLIQKEMQLTISSEGYESVTKSIVLNKNNYKSVNYLLKLKPVSINKIIVTASQVNLQSPITSNKTLLREDIENTVTLGNDPVRATQSIPGNSSSGLSGKTKTRGGNENESLILLDNHIIRNPYHFKNFFSLFSTINLSTVSSLDFYSGVFPTQYGGRLSSVLDVQTADNFNQPSHEIGFDLINAYYTYRHSSNDYNQQFLSSIRTGGKLVNKHFIKNNIIKPEFDDAYFKTKQLLNDNWHSSQHLLMSRDEISINDTDKESTEVANADHHDQNFWSQFNYDNLKNIQANLQFQITRKHNSRSGNIKNENTIGSISEDILTKYYGLKYDQTINIQDDISINFGLDLRQEETNINRYRNINHYSQLVNQLGLNSQKKQQFIFENQGLSLDLFFNIRYQFNKKLIFDLGLHYEEKQWIDDNMASPRFNLSYFYNDSTTLRFALGRHQQAQYIDELLLEDETPSYFNPTSADIAIIEFNKTFSANLNFRTEVYIKKYSSTQPYYENLFNPLHILPDLFYDRIRITPDDSQSAGAEVTLNGNNKYFKWSASYILSDVDDLIDGLEIPRSWDQHNALKFNLHIPINNKYINNWYLDLVANYHNGWGKTDIIESVNNLEIDLRNNETFDDFHQIDIKFSKQYSLQHGQLNFAIQANNIFQTKNPCCINYTLDDGSLKIEEKNWLSIIPNLSIVYKWD